MNNAFKSFTLGMLLSTTLASSSFATNLFGDPAYNQEENCSKRIIVSGKKIEEINSKLSAENYDKQIERLKGALSIWSERLQQNEKLHARAQGKELALRFSKTPEATLTLPQEILFSIFKHLSPKSISKVAAVSTEWNQVSSDERLWKPFANYLSFLVSDRIPNFKAFVTGTIKHSFVNSIDSNSAECNNALIICGSQTALSNKIMGLDNGWYGYTKDTEAPRELNETLVAQGNPQAISRKINGLKSGGYGYTENPEALREFNETLVAQGNSQAISRKMRGLESGIYGYTQNSVAFDEFNETLVAQSDPQALIRKIRGLEEGKYGYTQDPSIIQKYISALSVLRP